MILNRTDKNIKNGVAANEVTALCEGLEDIDSEYFLVLQRRIYASDCFQTVAHEPAHECDSNVVCRQSYRSFQQWIEGIKKHRDIQIANGSFTQREGLLNDFNLRGMTISIKKCWIEINEKTYMPSTLLVTERQDWGKELGLMKA